MENKKGAYPNTLTTPETSHNEAIPAHTHQHNTAPQLRLVQHGLKIPNHHAHTHQHQSQTFPSNSHQHIQSSLHQHNPQSFGQNQRHQHYQAEQQFLHQHPQKLHQHQNQTYYQQPNPLNQQNPQIWVPHQPPVHYHSQPPRNEPQPATPPQPIRMERKKSGGNHQQLRSPSAKRPVEAPVTMQGWLHKQGSEGLMLWKKRWFVLSEYCLFYYKGPEEEKLLGSILLPSYKVSMCGPEDKVTRRFAFKCEHANMRTYLLAADSQELMIQWIRVLNMACLLQSNNELEQQQISPSISNPSALNSSESEYHHYKQTSNTPIHMHSSSNTTDLSQQELSQYSQPLYANAPPKPRRLTDGGYSSPSPEVVDRYSAEPKYLPQQYVNRPIYVRKTIAKSPLTVGRKPEYQEYPPQIYCTKDAPQERRTPDTYGRSRLNPATKSRNPSDYEDIYGEQYMYKRPLSPLAYTDRMNQVQRIYTPVMRQYIPAQRRQPPNTIPRPHSADFLEYEVKHQENPGRQQPRPKSSLDINQHNDNYFYSEERYAEKMRKSAQYLPKISKYPTNSIYQESQKYAPLDKSYPLMRSNTQPVNFNQVSVNELPERDSQPIRSRSVLSEGSLSKEVDMDLSPAREAVSPAFGNRQEQIYRYNERKLISNYEQFTRSASARLAQSNVQVDKRQFEGRGANREGERKREESMKRLLEWKQRMLQSPLNRNVDNNYLYKTYPEPYVEIQRSTNTIPQYNSYSSDDEENEDRSKENVQTQAGWTKEIYPTVSSCLTPALTTTAFSSDNSDTMHDSSTSANSVEPLPVVSTKLNQESKINENKFAQPLKLSSKQSTHTAHVSSLRSEFSNKFEQNPTVTEIKSNGAFVRNILAEPKEDLTNFENIIEENYMTMTPKKNILDPENSHTDESPYVEMTQGRDLSLFDSKEQQPYEMVCFLEGKMEPVYMELNHGQGVFDNENSKLPDILIPSQNNTNRKSDSSDADDEASKDLDSLDTPCHPRFSLSDTFRPASYYLGARTAPELQDSSDSELVSPPPIPTSPPPLDDFDDWLSSTQDALESKEQRLCSNKPELSKLVELKKQSFLMLKDQDSSSLSSINTDIDVELRGARRSNFDLKRRPVSEEFFDELALLDKRSAKKNNHKYYHDYENLHKNTSIREDSTLSPTDFIQRARPESSASLSGEISGFLQSSSLRSTPSIRASSSLSTNEISAITNYFSGNRSRELDINPSAPYYYSDLSMNTSYTDSSSKIFTLNNQRGAMNGSKRDITRIINPIRCNNRARNRPPQQNLIDNTFKLAAEARSVSMDFLNLADKSGQIDKKNIYESDTLKRLKVADSLSSLPSKTEMKNLYPRDNDKFRLSTNVRRTYSLEGLLENVLSESMEVASEFSVVPDRSEVVLNPGNEGSHLWEEDSIWRECLRSASQRHTKSLDDLDCIGQSEKVQKKQKRSISRVVTYVNDNMFNMPLQAEMKPEGSEKENSFVIDREKLRQWDLLSSAPSDTQTSLHTVEQGSNNSVVDLSVGVSIAQPSEQCNNDDSASGSISFNTRDTFPRVIPAKRIWMSVAKPSQARSVGNLSRNHENDYAGLNRQQQGYFMGVSQQDLSSDTSQSSNPSRKKNLQWGDKTNLSAGELLGRTHEELVLLLIQLRRQSTNLCHAIEACYNEIDNIQTKLNTMEAAKRLENLQKLEQIKQHLLELEKQYEKGKPLVNLVDNMVKLGSLYRSPKDRNNFNPYFRDRLEFNQQIQERRLLAEERRDWSRLSPSHTELHAKVQQLYQLDRLIQEESNTLQGLQQDKEEIERALGGLRQRLHKGFNNPAEVEQARKQQIILETELSRVHLMLAENSKKLGETVAGNARLEQELLVLKQKLQVSRQQRSSPQISNAGDSLPCVVGTSAMLESDLQRVQQKVGDLQRQRQELSMQVRQLTDRSNNLQPGRPSSTTPLQNPNKKKMNSLWRETDLDTMNAIDHGEYDNGAIPITPLYINTDLKQNSDGEFYGRKLSDSTSDDTTLTFMPQEKQEIKTVRIVKRESERRQRDREKVATGKWDPVVEEDDSSQNSSVLFRPAPVQKILPVQEKQNSPSPNLSQAYPGTAASDGSLDKSPELSPVFKSEAARQIIIEMANDAPKHTNRRAVPKEKRRHYTAPHNNLIMKSLNQLPTTDSDFDKLDLNGRRARDDLDMERALRQRIDAPDVVRSTLSNKELKYNESTIDNILGTPNKILIPERYIPEQLPQLSVEEQQHRLRKVESIKKMLSDTTIISGSSANLASDDTSTDSPLSSFTNKATTKMIEEKKQREHLLQLNQILAKQVMEMSKIVAGTNNPNEQ